MAATVAEAVHMGEVDAVDTVDSGNTVETVDQETAT